MSYGIVAMPPLLKDVCHDPSGPLAELNENVLCLGEWVVVSVGAVTHIGTWISLA